MAATPRSPHHRPEPNPRRRSVRLFGGLHVQENGATRTVPAGRAQALLAYLLLVPRPHTRDRLIDVLWEEAEPNRARRNFSDVLYRLRQALGDGWLRTEGDTVALFSPHLWVDVWRFEELLAMKSLEAVAQAVDLYRGELLPELYDDWILPQRVALEESFLAALELLAQDAEARHEYERALGLYRRLTEADPLRELGHAGMIRSLGKCGRLADALQVYERMHTLFANELGVAPSGEVEELVEHLRSERELARRTPPRPHRFPFVGRIRERQKALAAVEEAVAGRGGILAVEGEAGIGKSRFVGHLRAGVEWREAVFVQVGASHTPAATPYTPLIDLFAASLAGPRAAQVESLLPAVTLAAFAPLYGAWRHAADLPDVPETVARQRFHHAVLEVTAALCRLAPHVFVIDDVHWAEPALWQVLTALAHEVAHLRLLLILTYRRPEMRAGSLWPLLQKWEAAGHLRVLTLPPLTVEEVARLLPSPRADSAAAIHASTGGNPFYVAEALAVADQGTVAVRQATTARVNVLSETERRALDLAAVIGVQIPYRLWQKASRLSPLALADAGESLTVHSLLRPLTGGYEFVHELVQEAIYAQVPSPRRRELHRRVAATLAALEQENLRLRAYHLDRAGNRGAASRLYHEIGRQEMARFAYVEAQKAFERSLTLLDRRSSSHEADRLDILLELAHACEVTGDRAQQRSALQEALALARRQAEDEQLLRGLVQWAELEERTGRHEAAEEALAEALTGAIEAGNRQAELDIDLIAGDLALRRGETARAIACFEEGLSLARALGNGRQEGRALEGLAWAAAYTNRPAEEAYAYYEQALAVQEACGDELGAARTRLNLFTAAHNAGDWGRVLALADGVLPALQRVGYRLGEGAARQTLGLMAITLGDYEEAVEHLTAARGIFQEVDDPLAVAVAESALGVAAQRRGRVDEALAHYRRSAERATEIGSSVFRAFALQDWGILLVERREYASGMVKLQEAIAAWEKSGERLNVLKCGAFLGLALLALGEQPDAVTLAEQGWRAYREDRPGGEESELWLWALARLLRALGRVDEADRVLRSAFDELLRIAGTIPEAARRRFFERSVIGQAVVADLDDPELKPRQVVVHLPRSDAPRGRAPTADEQVAVTWTLQAPEDALYPNKTERRRGVLRRLLAEAAAHNAAPTDQDLAAALGVSRRTVLRDREALAAQGSVLPAPARRV